MRRGRVQAEQGASRRALIGRGWRPDDQPERRSFEGVEWLTSSKSISLIYETILKYMEDMVERRDVN